MEIGGHAAFPRHEPRTLGFLARLFGIQRHDLGHGLARLGDQEAASMQNPLDEPRRMRLGLMNVDGFHSNSILSPFDLIYIFRPLPSSPFPATRQRSPRWEAMRVGKAGARKGRS